MDENIWYYIDDKISWDPRNVSCYHTYTCYKCLYMVKQKTKKPFNDYKMHFRYERARRVSCRYWNGIIRSIRLCSTTFPPALKSQSSLTFTALSLRSKTCKEVWSLVGNLAYLGLGECCIWLSGLKRKCQNMNESIFIQF